MRKFKPTQINLLPKKKSFPIYVKKEVQWGNATERETDVWLTPKAEIMTHQSFQSGQNETAFVYTMCSVGKCKSSFREERLESRRLAETGTVSSLFLGRN